VIRIAFAGKGGSGKSSISGTFARLLARRDRSVLAVDSDPLPGMAYSLGIAVDDHPAPDDVVVVGPEGGPRWVLRPGLDAAGFIETYASSGPDHVRYLQFGNTWGHFQTLQRGQHAWSQVVREMDPAAWNVVGDLPGGTHQAMFGWAKYADVLVLVVEPTAKSIHVARRLQNISKAEWAPSQVVVVANCVDDDGDIERISEALEHPVIGAIPNDSAVTEADKLALSPLDHRPGPFVEAVEQLVGVVESTYDLDIQPPTYGKL
jgi:CO dehydrogenase maturation factor